MPPPPRDPLHLSGCQDAIAIAAFCGGTARGGSAKRSQDARTRGRSAIGDARPRRSSERKRAFAAGTQPQRNQDA
eukprot:12949017-Alexandrium_andersonii.AAC.1